jgi:hypothetical protein
VAAGSLLPWIQAKSRVTVGLAGLGVGVSTQPQASCGGLDEGAGALLAGILALDALALLVAVALMARRRRRGLVLRLLALGCGLGATAVGVYFLLAIKEDQAGDLFETVLVSIKPGLGAYLLTLGGLTMITGALVPGRRGAGTTVA